MPRALTRTSQTPDSMGETPMRRTQESLLPEMPFRERMLAMTRCGFLLVLIALTFTARAESIRLEAEDATLQGTMVSTNRPGFSGKGYVTGMDRKTDRILFRANIPAGLYQVAIRYSSPFGPKGYVLDVNGLKISGTFAKTGNEFATRSAGLVEIPQTGAALAIEYGWGFYDIDYIEFTPAAAPKPPSKPPLTLSDSEATPEARALMARLVSSYGQATLSGVQSLKEVEPVRKITGRMPAIVGEDLMDYSPSRLEHGAKPGKLVEKMIEHHQQGRVVTLMWHWNAPAGLEPASTNAQGQVTTQRWWSGFYTKATTFDLKRALASPDSAERELLLRDLDSIAGELKKLATANVPVLWRPLHEAEGGWFWWGAKGPRPFVTLWRLMYERLSRHHGLHNLVWVFTGSANAEWYPGDNVVDIVGLDAYPENVRDPLTGPWAELQQRFAGKKLVALTEFGGVPDVEQMQRLGVWFAYFVPWTGKKGPLGMPEAEVKRIYNLPGVVGSSRD